MEHAETAEAVAAVLDLQPHIQIESEDPHAVEIAGSLLLGCCLLSTNRPTTTTRTGDYCNSVTLDGSPQTLWTLERST